MRKILFCLIVGVLAIGNVSAQNTWATPNVAAEPDYIEEDAPSALLSLKVMNEEWEKLLPDTLYLQFLSKTTYSGHTTNVETVQNLLLEYGIPTSDFKIVWKTEDKYVRYYVKSWGKWREYSKLIVTLKKDFNSAYYKDLKTGYPAQYDQFIAGQKNE